MGEPFIEHCGGLGHRSELNRDLGSLGRAPDRHDGAEGLGNDRFCLTAVSTCHRKEKGKFSIGEYVSVDARRGRIAAAYVLPRPDSVSTRARRGTPAVYVTTLAEPPR